MAMKKRILGIMLVFMMGILGVQSLAAEKIKIGFLLKTMQEERYQKDKAAFEAKAKSLGATVVFDSANNDEQTQMSKFENMLSKGVQVIVLQPVNTGTAGKMVEMANREGVKVVGYDSLLVNGPLDLHVMQDSWAVGKLQAEAMVNWIKAKKGKVVGNIVLIKGQPGDSNAEAMSAGVYDILKKNPGLKLVAAQSHEGWSPDKAMATTENVLSKYKNNIDAFICNNSGMARGVIAALEAQGLADTKKVFVAGSDADLINIRYILQGKQSVDVFKKIKPLAEMAAEAAVKLAKNPNKKVTDVIKFDKKVNNKFTDVPVIVTPIVLVTKSNIDATVIKDGFHKKEDVYKK